MFGACSVVVGAAAQVAGKNTGLRPVWIGLIAVGSVLAVPVVVLQSPWWRERLRTQQDRKRRRRADDRHFETSGRGVLRPDWPGFYFTGRRRALRALAGFLDGVDGPDRVRVVVGLPGSGKSALLGRLVLLADPVRRRAAKDAGPIAPVRGTIAGAIHARGKDVNQILRALTECADLPVEWTDVDRPTAVLVDELLFALQDRSPPMTVVIDALDEAVEPERVMREVIRPLVDSAPEVGIRLVLGLRRQLLHLLDVPPGAVVDLDTPAYFDRADMVEYAQRCLTLDLDPGTPSPYRADPGYARQVASVIADQAGQVFLIAQLTARALACDPAVVDLSSPAWRTSFPSRVGTAMDALLSRFADGDRVRDLLVPLAFAEGSGLPPGPLWAALAGALGTSVHTEQDVRWLLSSTPAADLLQRIELDDGDLRYRLFHEALAEHLRERVAHLAPHSAISRALLDLVGRTAAGERDWRTAHSYVRAHLATHAARSGHLDELVSDPNFLLVAEPDPLLRALPAVRGRPARQAAAIYRGVVHLLRTCDAREAAAQLELHARQQCHQDLADRVAGTNHDRPWSVPWVSTRPVHPHQVVGRHANDVNAVAVVTVDGRLRVVSGGASGEVGVWDIEDGTRLGAPIGAPAGGVNAVAVGRAPDGTTVVVLGGDEGLWTARLDGSQPSRAGIQTGIRCVAVTRTGGAAVVVAGDVDGRIGVYDLVSGACLREPFDAHADGVQTLLPGELPGRSVVVSGGIDGSVTMWELSDPHPITTLPAAATESAATMALSTVDGRPSSVTVGGLDGLVRVWDLGSGRPVAIRILGYDGWLNCLTLATFAGRAAVVGGAMDGRVLVWRGPTGTAPDEAAQGEPADLALAGHDGWVSSVAATADDGRDLVVTGGLDGTVRAWNLADADLVADGGDAHDGEVTTVALLTSAGERSTAVSGSTDGTIRLWRLSDGGLLADPIAAHDQGVRVVTTAGPADRPVIASGGNDGTVRVWDGLTGHPLGDPIMAHKRTVRALLLLSLDRRLILVTGGDGGVRRWDALSGRPIGDALAEDQEIRAIAGAVTAGRPVLVAGGDHGLSRWHLLTSEPIGPVLAPDVRVNAVAVRRGETTATVLAGTETSGIRSWDVAGGMAVGEPLATDRPIRSLVVSDSGDRPVAVSGDEQGCTVHPLRGQRRAQRIRLGFRVDAIAAVTSSSLLVGSWRGLYSLNVADGE